MKFSLGEITEIPLGDLEERFFRGILEYWQVKKKNHFAPSWESIDLMALTPKVIPFVTVVDVVYDPLDFVYRFWGTGHVKATGLDRTGARVTDHPQGRGQQVFAEYNSVFEEQRPIAFSRKLVFPDGKLPLKQTALRMPLTQDGKNVDKIISVADWNKFRDHWDDRSVNLSALGNQL